MYRTKALLIFGEVLTVLGLATLPQATNGTVSTLDSVVSIVVFLGFFGMLAWTDDVVFEH